MSPLSAFSREYLQGRRDDFYDPSKFTIDPEGCWISILSARPNGDPQLKLRWEGKQASPRPWTLHLFLQGITVPQGHDASHLCGKGLQGCFNPDHIWVEEHRINLDRRDCHRRTTCPHCNQQHRVRHPCNHTPQCL